MSNQKDDNQQTNVDISKAKNADSQVQQTAVGQYSAQAAFGGKALVNVFTGQWTSIERQAILNRNRMLQRVYDFWIEGFLDKSLHRDELIQLHMALKPEAVSYPWLMIIQRDNEQKPLVSGTRIIDVYHENDGQFLILGSPGSGKTTVLLELARDLIDEAEDNPALPIPVVLNLSSWAQERLPLSKWLINELNIRYDVPKKVARDWVAGDALTLLLDGLDEVDEQYRLACLQEINDFRGEHGFIPIVVCSRIEEYETLTSKLNLKTAVVLQPLTLDDIVDYMENLGEEFDKAHQLIKKDHSLQELAKSPLMLNIICIAGLEGETEHFEKELSPSARYRQLFDVYIERMITRPRSGQALSYTPAQLKRWLSWLAIQMHERRQSSFLVEQIQPTWLSSDWQKTLYDLGVRGVLGFLLTIIFFNFFYFVTKDLWGGMVYGIVSSFIIVLSWDRFKRITIPQLKQFPLGILEGILFGLFYLLIYVYEILTNAPWYFNGEYNFYLLTGLGPGFIMPAMVMFIVAGFISIKQVKIVDKVIFNWRTGLLRGIPVGLVLGIPFALWGAGVPNFGSGLSIVIISIVVLSQTNATNLDEDISRPNQGIRRSLSYAFKATLGLGGVFIAGLQIGFSFAARDQADVVAGIQYGIVLAIVFLIAYILFVNAIGERSRTYFNKKILKVLFAFSVSLALFAIWYGYRQGFDIGFVYSIPGAVAFFMMFGGFTVVQHYLVRYLLYQAGDIPWDYPAFLNDVTERVILRRVGGSFLFVHRLLLEHFALHFDSKPEQELNPSSFWSRFHPRSYHVASIIFVLILIGLSLILRQV